MARKDIVQDTDRQPQTSTSGEHVGLRPIEVGQPLPAICLVRDVAQVLRVSESRVYQLRAEGKLREFLLPAIDGTLRFNGRKLSDYRDGTFEPKALRLRRAV